MTSTAAMVPGKATMPLTAGTGQPVRDDVTPTGRDTPASGKVIVARAPRSSSPLRSRCVRPTARRVAGDRA